MEIPSGDYNGTTSFLREDHRQDAATCRTERDLYAHEDPRARAAPRL
jgi:hypothetical protein